MSELLLDLKKCLDIIKHCVVFICRFRLFTKFDAFITRKKIL